MESDHDQRQFWHNDETYRQQAAKQLLDRMDGKTMREILSALLEPKTTGKDEWKISQKVAVQIIGRNTIEHTRGEEGNGESKRVSNSYLDTT